MESLRLSGRGSVRKPCVCGGFASRTSIIALLGAAVLLFAAGAAREARFQVSTVAVVDMALVFEDYEKTKDKRSTLDQKRDDIQARLKDLEREYDRIVADIVGTAEDSPKYLDLLVEKKKLELNVEKFKKEELESLRDEQLALLREIRDEISGEIAAYAKSHDIDFVVERHVTLEPGDQWPILHFAKAPFDITQDVITVLNAKYKRKT